MVEGVRHRLRPINLPSGSTVGGPGNASRYPIMLAAPRQIAPFPEANRAPASAAPR